MTDQQRLMNIQAQITDLRLELQKLKRKRKDLMGNQSMIEKRILEI